MGKWFAQFMVDGRFGEHGAGSVTLARADAVSAHCPLVAREARLPRLVNSEVWPAYSNRFEPVLGRRVMAA